METPKDDNVVSIGETRLEWFQRQKLESGITDEMANHAGIVVHYGSEAQGKLGAFGLVLPYYDRHGQLTDRYRVRVHPSGQTKEGDLSNYDSDGNLVNAQGRISKYWQPRRQKNSLFWPKMVGVDHAANIDNPDAIIVFVEGEKKAMSVQRAMLKNMVLGSAVGIPGVVLPRNILDDLATLRIAEKLGVFIAFDFNDVGAAETATRKGEWKLQTRLLEVGAKHPYVIRWPVKDGSDEGTQKIDDFLFAGGDLKALLLDAEEQNYGAGNRLQKMMFALNEEWGFLNGTFVRIGDKHRGSVLSKDKFFSCTEHLFVEMEINGKEKIIAAAKAWMQWDGKRELAGLCFKPPGLGESPQQFVDGCFNLSPEWTPPVVVNPWEEEPMLKPELIEELLENFCESDAHFTWLKQHIAHTLVRPDVPTSQVVVFRDNGGTGKGLLTESLTRLGPKLVKEVDLGRGDNFNGELEGVVVAVWNEPSKIAGRTTDMEALIKRLVGSPRLMINGKGQPLKEVENRLHIFVTMNLHYVVHMNEHDRRFNFFEAKRTIKSSEEGGNDFGAEYAYWMDNDKAGFLATWHDWAHGIDLTGYSPNRLGPSSEVKKMAVGLSASPEEEFFTLLRNNKEKCKSFEMPWLVQQYNIKMGEKTPDVTPHRMAFILRKYGFVTQRIKVQGNVVTFAHHKDEVLTAGDIRKAYEEHPQFRYVGPKH